MTPADRRARDLELLDAIDKFDRSSFDGIVWRIVRETRDVLHASRVGARWDPALFDVIYTSLDRNGAIEEIYFHLSRQPVFPSVPFQLHRLRLRVKQVLNIGEMKILERLGVDVSTFAGFDYDRTQAIGDAAFFLGFGGLIVPSARSAAKNMVIFPERVRPDEIEVEHSEPIDWKAWRAGR
jgi:RES domain-containing protein